MIPEEAIDILSEAAYAGSITFNEDFKSALKLGTEALKEVIKRRGTLRPGLYPLLPGETAE